ncbi:MAG TPA: hypothetical protein VNZ52_00810 [Candidatus Thermoplasmatota archaeon]|nr:hypothetical protein [Candidatus Thermoplasmatota archaeon]
MGSRGPPDLGKTKTIKQRRIDVYLPTLEAKERWGEAAAKRRQKVSEMVFELVETALAPPVGADQATPQQLVEELEDLRADLEAQRRRIEELTLLKESLEQELATYRAQAVADTGGVPKLDSRLVRLFSEARGRDGRHRVVEAPEVRKALRITARDEDQGKALNLSLEAMELHGWIKRAGKGWVWHGK